MPWNPLLGAARLRPVQRAIDAVVRRQASDDAGIIPPTPPHFDVRTPEYVVFPTVQRTPWECVRGMDQSFGYNAQSRPEDFLRRRELLWSFVDIVAKGGNLLLNVGPRGVDAQIPDEQPELLGALGSWLVPRALPRFAPPDRGSSPGTTTTEGAELRYTVRRRRACSRSCVERRTR